MEPFDKEGNIKYILRELKKTDEFYNNFKKEFSESISVVIKQFYPELQIQSIDDILQTYAVEVLNSTESVIDKDRNYPSYRLNEELNVMDRLVAKLPEPMQNIEFMEAIHQKAKWLMVKYYDDIMELSANGFRLLERNVKMYHWEFISNFYSILEKKIR